MFNIEAFDWEKKLSAYAMRPLLPSKQNNLFQPKYHNIKDKIFEAKQENQNQNRVVISLARNTTDKN